MLKKNHNFPNVSGHMYFKKWFKKHNLENTSIIYIYHSPHEPFGVAELNKFALTASLSPYPV